MSELSRPVRWLVQRAPEGDDSPTFDLLRRACDVLGLPLDAIEVPPGMTMALPRSDGPVVVHGRSTLLRAALADADHRRGVFFDASAFTPSAYVEHWGARMLNSDQQLLPWLDAVRANERERLFVRPDDDDKLFTGRVFEPGELHGLFRAAHARGRVAAEDRVVVAPPREIDAEARVFVVDGTIAGQSYYRPDASLGVPEEMLAFAREAIVTWSPSEVFALDLARVDGRTRIVEANCFNGSRFYGADVVRIVDRVSRFQRARW